MSCVFIYLLAAEWGSHWFLAGSGFVGAPRGTGSAGAGRGPRMFEPVYDKTRFLLDSSASGSFLGPCSGCFVTFYIFQDLQQWRLLTLSYVVTSYRGNYLECIAIFSHNINFVFILLFLDSEQRAAVFSNHTSCTWTQWCIHLLSICLVPNSSSL